MKAQPIPGIH